jgi:Ca2+-dependent lipid-binding protein
VVPTYKSIENVFKEKNNHLLVFYLYKGENFPPANVEGDCDPFIRFNCEGVSKESKPIEGSFNPMWQEIIQMPVKIQDVFDNELTKGVVCEAYDHEKSGKHQYIGSFLIELNNNLLS